MKTIFDSIDAKLNEHKQTVQALRSQGFRLFPESAWPYAVKDTGISRPGSGEILRAATPGDILEQVKAFREKYPLKQKRTKQSSSGTQG